MKLNLGCGNRKQIPGFTNIDIIHGKNIDIQCDARRLPMIHNNSIELIYASHVLEYFDKSEVKVVLHEWYRILKPKGILRLAVPDFAKLCIAYLIAEFPLDNITGPLYGKMKTNQSYIYHKTCYDFNTLRKLLEDCGFNNIHEYDWKKTIHKDYDDWSQSYLPHMEKDKGILISLNVEATKV